MSLVTETSTLNSQCWMKIQSNGVVSCMLHRYISVTEAGYIAVALDKEI